MRGTYFKMGSALACMGCLLLVGCGKPGGSGTVIVRDAAEVKPIMTYNGKVGFDIDSVTISSDGTALRFSVVFASPVSEVMKVHRIGLSPLSVEVDSDENRDSGGIAWDDPPVGGFESEVRLYLSAQYPNGGMGWQGGDSSQELVGVVPTYIIAHYQQGEEGIAMRGRMSAERIEQKDSLNYFERNSERAHLDASTVIFSVPYAELKAKSGQTLRLLFHEEYAIGTTSDIFFGETTYTLK